MVFALITGLLTVIFSAASYTLSSVIVLRVLGLVDVDVTRAAVITTHA